MKDKLNAIETAHAGIALPSHFGEAMDAQGTYHFKCFTKDGELLWEDNIENVVCTVGKNLALQTILTGSGYTVTGPYMGLISSVSYTTGPVASDTMASHSGWTEAGSTNAPTFAARVAPAFGTASGGSISTSSVVSFTMTSAGTLKGAFIVYGTGAVSTLMSTTGTLLSAGTFSGGDQPVANTNVVQVTYTLSV